METSLEIRTCKECGAKLVGRADQKFCGDMCRTSANNRRRAEDIKNMPNCILSIQKTLLNNYRILTELRKRGEQFSTMYLQDLGFSFRHLTSVTEQDGAIHYHCFNECYVITDQAMILINE
jgi:hypothetical protein